MTTGLNLYFDGAITTERNNYDWESIGKLMYADAGFRTEMLSRNPKSADWMSNASSMEVMEGLMPVAVSSGVGSWAGTRFLSTNSAASGAIAYGNVNDPFLIYAQRAKPYENYLDVVLHGSPRGVWYRPDMMIDHRVLANLIRNSPQFAGQPIRLLSCNTGRLADGFAKNLSNALGVGVRAPEDIIWAFPDGKLSIGPTYIGGKSFVNFSVGIKK
ncbi:hypothetical protein C7475_101267 [Chitinophaga sp. S165]|nr:hypothetical protein C7475_101267 [Chitinophaga sp. S165]